MGRRGVRGRGPGRARPSPRPLQGRLQLLAFPPPAACGPSPARAYSSLLLPAAQSGQGDLLCGRGRQLSQGLPAPVWEGLRGAAGRRHVRTPPAPPLPACARTLQILVLALEGLQMLQGLLVGVLELEELGAEGGAPLSARTPAPTATPRTFASTRPGSAGTQRTERLKGQPRPHLWDPGSPLGPASPSLSLLGGMLLTPACRPALPAGCGPQPGPPCRSSSASCPGRRRPALERSTSTIRSSISFCRRCLVFSSEEHLALTACKAASS